MMRKENVWRERSGSEPMGWGRSVGGRAVVPVPVEHDGRGAAGDDLLDDPAHEPCAVPPTARQLRMLQPGGAIEEKRW